MCLYRRVCSTGMYEAIKDIDELKKAMEVLSGMFLKTFNMFNVSQLAKSIGVSSSLMGQYKTGKIYISEARKKQIESGIHNLANELLQVRF